jgi:hypothetical protein
MGAATATVAGANPFHDGFLHYQLLVLNGLGSLFFLWWWDAGGCGTNQTT